jgi:hypothetical protein
MQLNRSHFQPLAMILIFLPAVFNQLMTVWGLLSSLAKWCFGTGSTLFSLALRDRATAL